MPSFHLSLFYLFILRAAVLAATGHLPSIANPQNDLVTPNLSAIIRRPRQVTALTNSDNSWRTSKTPPFITAQMKKQQVEPILTVISSDGAIRNAKNREFFQPEYNVGKRIIYHTTLPDVPHSPTRPPYNAYGEFVGSLRSDQRSYDANKGGHEFKVQSALINVSGIKDKTNTDNRKSNPSFVILENPSPQHYQVNGLNRFAPHQPAGYHNHMTDITYQHQSPYQGHHKPYISDFKLPYSSSLPYYNTENDLGISRYQYQYQHQSSPYYEEIEKLHAPGHEFHHYQNYASNSPLLSPPYPSRHVRFPTNRYPSNFPFNDLLSSAKPQINLLNKNPLDSGLLQHSPNLGLGDSLPTNPSGLDYNNNLGPVTMDQNSALDNNNRFSNTPPRLKNKFPNFDKYPSDTSSNFDSEFPFNSQFSDKPFDFGEFSSAAAEINNGVTGDKDYHIKAGTQNGFGNGVKSTTEPDETNKTPPTTSSSDTNTDETQTDSDYGAELD